MDADLSAVTVERQTTAERINAVLNDPIVRPWVADMAEGVLDLSAVVADPKNVILMGEHGGVAFLGYGGGIYEAHTQVLPAGRGAWTVAMARAAVRWMFERTDAWDLLTRVPHGHRAAKALTLRIGGKFEFTCNAPLWPFRGKKVPVDVYSTRLQDWVLTDPAWQRRGRWVHERMRSEAARLGITEPPHEPDENHNCVVGACYEMAAAGRPAKAVGWYNRWALVARHPTILLVSEKPPEIKFDIGNLRLANGDLEVIPC